jgi:predicted DCC family thiol-disulfide oxidoreductase YuxK
MGADPAGGAPDLPGLSRSQPSLYLLVYDAESAACRGMIDWIQRRDQHGLVVSFPSQNAELLHVAPEFAGLALVGEVHGFDTRSRVIRKGARMLPELFRRLPGWGCLVLAPLACLPGVSSLLYAYLRRRR